MLFFVTYYNFTPANTHTNANERRKLGTTREVIVRDGKQRDGTIAQISFRFMIPHGTSNI